jgi:hypothetical protein
VKAAYERGEVIEWRHQAASDEERNWRVTETPGWLPYNRYRVKPWTLPDPPEGREWHRVDGWRKEWLTDGWRPLLKGEYEEVDDERLFGGEERWRHNKYRASLPCQEYPSAWFFRTRRPLPDPQREAFDAFYGIDGQRYLPITPEDVKNVAWAAWQESAKQAASKPAALERA